MPVSLSRKRLKFLAALRPDPGPAVAGEAEPGRVSLDVNPSVAKQGERHSRWSARSRIARERHNADRGDDLGQDGRSERADDEEREARGQSSRNLMFDVT
jgi:hypothetical protein